MPLCTPISPQFLRRREDKQATPLDVRAQQVATLVEVPLLDTKAGECTLPKSEVLRREVYVKLLKGNKMVRKAVMWKTNKETQGTFPAYVAAFTDFSPGRATPMDRDIRISNSEEQIKVLYDLWITENIVKGWNRA